MSEAVAVPFLVVLSSWDEPPYEGDPLSFPRRGISFTLHLSDDEAHRRLEAEAAFCLTPEQRRARRLCGLLRVSVPSRVLAGGLAHRWCSDRLPELARRARLGAPPDPAGALEAAFSEPSRWRFLLAALEAAQAGLGEEAVRFVSSLSEAPPGLLPTLRQAADAVLVRSTPCGAQGADPHNLPSGLEGNGDAGTAGQVGERATGTDAQGQP